MAEGGGGGGGLAQAGLRRPSTQHPCQQEQAGHLVAPKLRWGGAWYPREVGGLWSEEDLASSAQMTVRFGAAGHTLPGAARGVVSCRSSHDVSPTVLTRSDDVAQGWIVYKAASHELPHASSMIILGGQSGEVRLREVRGLAPGHTAEGHHGWDCNPWALRP